MDVNFLYLSVRMIHPCFISITARLHTRQQSRDLFLQTLSFSNGNSLCSLHEDAIRKADSSQFKEVHFSYMVDVTIPDLHQQIRCLFRMLVLQITVVTLLNVHHWENKYIIYVRSAVQGKLPASHNWNEVIKNEKDQLE